ncbi:MAG: hypothetical protein LBQ87_07000 [Candidatus Fibromonas sp.]|jgi:hypothetical protein|nr:hypothetical protein [Candidatus Fibromonas sp.]
MKRLLFVLLLSSAAFSETAVEISMGLSSPNKGLVGARYASMPWSYGFIWGSFSNYSDFGLAASYHLFGYSGPYIFHSHHWLNSDKGPAKNTWEIDTGAGYQFVFRDIFLVYAELGIPFFIGNGRVYRHYESGRPYNKAADGDIILVSLRTGIGIGATFVLW